MLFSALTRTRENYLFRLDTNLFESKRLLLLLIFINKFHFETLEENSMKRVYLSCFADHKLVSFLRHKGLPVVSVKPSGRTYSPVDAHPDMYYCKMGVTDHPHLFRGNPLEIGASYPANIPFNAVCLKGYLIHNLKHTSPSLLHAARELGLRLIHVRQGYTKCNCVVVDGHSLITADKGIIHTLKKCPDLGVLPISQGFVRLDGFEYGFLGGASGRVGEEIIFNGNLSAHPDFEAIVHFITSRGLGVKYFPEYPLTDIGSILTDF